jgi:hypothetical protein
MFAQPWSLPLSFIQQQMPKLSLPIARNNGSPVSNSHTFTIAATGAAEECKTCLPLMPKS